MDIHTTLAVASELSRSQLNLMISRYGWVPQGSGRKGTAREFTAADVFNLAVAGKLSSLGLDMPTIIDALAGMPMPNVSADFEQAEIFPGWSETRVSAAPVYLVFEATGEGMTGEFCDKVSVSEKAIVLNATNLARAVEAASGAARQP